MATWFSLSLLILSLLFPLRASAEALPRLQLSGNVWGQWVYDLSYANPESPDPNGANRFEVTRTYINFRAQITESISARITPDLVATSGTEGNLDGSLTLRLKYAYVTFEDALPFVSVRALMQPTPYIGFSDSIWGYRVLGSDILERFTGVRSSDVGLSLFGRPFEILEYAVLASNGEGYNRQERSEANAARYKDLAARLTFSPFAQAGEFVRRLRLSLFGQYGIREKAESLDRHIERIRGLALLTWQAPGFTLGTGGGVAIDDRVEELRVDRSQSFLWTSWGWVDLPLHLRAIARLDLDAPDDAGRRTRLIAGAAYLFSDEVQFIVNWERDAYQAPEEAPLGARGDSLFLRVAAEF